LSKRWDEFEKAGRPLVAISVDTREESIEFAGRKSLRTPLLSDSLRKVITAYGVADADNEIAVPSIFVISQEGNVLWRHVGETQMDRPGPDVLLEQLRP